MSRKNTIFCSFLQNYSFPRVTILLLPLWALTFLGKGHRSETPAEMSSDLETHHRALPPLLVALHVPRSTAISSLLPQPRQTSRWAPLLNAAKQCDIPTAQMTEGSVYFITDSTTNISQNHHFPKRQPFFTLTFFFLTLCLTPVRFDKIR